MALAIDASTPAAAVNSANTVAAVTTASFTPPANSLLVIMWSADSASAADPAAPSVTDSLGAHLTYTQQQWRHRASGTPAVDGQSAIWTAPVGSSAAMTVTVTNGAASGSRDAALQVVVLTDAGRPGAGASGAASGGTGTTDCTSAFTATATGSWGFLAACDWDLRGNMTADSGCSVISTGSTAGGVSYGFGRRATADGTSGSGTTVGLTPGATTANADWCYLEVTPAAGGGPPALPAVIAAPPPACPAAPGPRSRVLAVQAPGGPVSVSDADACSAADAAAPPAAALSDADSAGAAENGSVPGTGPPVTLVIAAQPSPDTVLAVPGSQLILAAAAQSSLADSDVSAAADAGESVLAAQQPVPLTARPGAGWQQRYGPRNRPRPQAFMPPGAPASPVPVSDADTASGEESPGVVFGSVQAAQVNSAAAVTSQAAALPAGVAQGSLVVACLAAGNNATSVTPPDASWRQAVLNQPAGASATIEAGVWYLVVDAAHAGQSSWTWTFSASHTVYVVTREWYCSAGWPSSPADVTAQGDTAGTPAAGTAVSSGTTAATSSAPELEVAALAYKGTAQAETGLSAGWSQGLEATLAANNTLREAYRVSSAPEAASASLSVGTAQFWAGAVAVFAPGPGSPSDSDAASAAESGEAVAASLASADAASAAEAGETAALSSPDAASAAEAAEAVSLSSPDAASAADAGEAAGPLGSPGPPVLTRQPGAAWAARYGPPGRARPQFLVAGALPPGPPAVFDSDDVHAEDSGFAAVSDADAASAADGDEAAAVTSAEAAGAAEAETAAWPQDRDAASAAEAQHWSGPLSDPAPEQGRAADGGERLALASADACSAADAAPVVEVYSFQPPFRWDGGGFELVWHAADGPGGYTGITVWRGPLPDGAAFRVWKVLSAASRVILVRDADTAAAREEHGPAIAGVSVSVAPAVTLLIQAG